MSGKYILDGHTAVPCDDLMAWGRWFETAKRHVAQTEISALRISTVFLGVDHGWGDEGAPILFETMIFGAPDDAFDGEYQTRCSTWEEAEEMHAVAVREAHAFLAKAP